MPEPRPELQEQQLESFKSEFVRLITTGVQSDSFTGVPEEIQPSLSVEGKFAEEQLAQVVKQLAAFMVEVLRVGPREIKLPLRVQEVNEQDGTTFTGYTVQLSKNQQDSNGWVPQLWVREVAVIEDTSENFNPDRIDRRLSSRLASAAERYRKLSEVNVPQAAQEEDKLLREMISSYTTKFEDSNITLQLFNPKERLYISVAGVRMMRSLAGYQAWPVFIVGGKKEVYDSGVPLIATPGHENQQLNKWCPPKEFNTSTMGQVIKGVVEKVLTIK